MTDENQKRSFKQNVLNEIREVYYMVAYLMVCFCFIATFRSLVLIQHGINDFSHSYLVAIVEALALGKIVALAQRLPLVLAWNKRPLLHSVLYKSVVMTLILDLGGQIEHLIFKHDSQTADIAHNVELMISHQFAFMFIFIVLFTWRDLDRALGTGTLKKLFLHTPEEK